MSKNKKTDTPPLKTETRQLPVKLTDNELRERGQDLARAAQKHEQEIATKKSTGAQLKAAVDSAAATVALLSAVVASGEEVRAVVCEWHLFDPKPTKKSLKRQDTGATVEVRDLTPDDTQRNLPGILSAADAQKKADEDKLKTAAAEAGKVAEAVAKGESLPDLKNPAAADEFVAKLAARTKQTPEERREKKNAARRAKREAAKAEGAK